MKKKIVYISGKITGDPEYLKKFNEAQVDIEHKGYEVINPAMATANLPKSLTWYDYMSICMAMIQFADIIVLLPDWKESPGSAFEYGYATATDKPVQFYEPDKKEEWDD